MYVNGVETEMAGPATVIAIVAFLLLLSGCILVFVWKMGGSRLMKVSDTLLCVLILCYALPELYYTEGKTTGLLGDSSQMAGVILLCALVGALTASVSLYVHANRRRQNIRTACRKCGLENVAGTWVCGDCKSLLPEYSVTMLAVVLVLLLVGFAVIGQILFLVLFAI